MPRPQRSTPKIKHRAIELRKESTPAEQKLWSKVRNDQLGITFRRHTCPGGSVPGTRNRKLHRGLLRTAQETNH